jgi:catechol 2,3-dioxygenase-like lactoylglutathione lyase family enzyme
MIDHITVVIANYDKAKAFYLGALAPLGYELVMELSQKEIPALPVERTCGIGEKGKPDLWLRPTTEPLAPTHIAFRAKDRATVEAFYTAALAAGGRDNGKPGPRPHYHPNYFGAFVLDPDGNNVEAVCHSPA